MSAFRSAMVANCGLSAGSSAATPVSGASIRASSSSSAPTIGVPVRPKAMRPPPSLSPSPSPSLSLSLSLSSRTPSASSVDSRGRMSTTLSPASLINTTPAAHGSPIVSSAAATSLLFRPEMSAPTSTAAWNGCDEPSPPLPFPPPPPPPPLLPCSASADSMPMTDQSGMWRSDTCSALASVRNMTLSDSYSNCSGEKSPAAAASCAANTRASAPSAACAAFRGTGRSRHSGSRVLQVPLNMRRVENRVSAARSWPAVDSFITCCGVT